MNKIYYFLFIFSLLFLFSFVSAKSYTLDKANIDMIINPDASINVSEKITYIFYGDYSYAFRTIPQGYWDISNISVLENGIPLEIDITNENNAQKITWYYTASNETKTYEIKYVLKNAINNYNDVSELNWKLWGGDWGLPLNEIYATIYFPNNVNDPKEVYTYGHPNLDGKIGMLDNNKIILQAFNIPKYQFVELRLIFPNYVLESNEFANLINKNGLQEIILEEESYGKINWLFIISSFFVLFLILFLIWYFFSKSKKINFKDIYLRDIPYNYSPSLVGYLYSFNNLPNAISADILNMCLKGKMKLEKIPKKGLFSQDDFKFIIIKDSDSGLSESEKFIFNKLKEIAKYGYDNYIIFKRKKVDNTPNELLLSEFKDYFKVNKFEGQYFTKKWQEQVKLDFEKEGLNFSFKGLLLILGVIFLFSFAGGMFNYYSFFFAMLLLIPILFFRGLFIKMDENTKLHYLKWKTFRKYIKHFSDFKNKEIMDIKLWEKYLVYAIPLGVADKVERDMKTVFLNYNGKVNSSIFVGGSFISVSNIASINSQFSTAFSSAMVTSGSSGFSGGSSGGGGGGGGGAG